MKKFILLAVVFLAACSHNSNAQTESIEKPAQIKEENPELIEAGFVNMHSTRAKLFFDMRYATENNFTKQRIYDSSKCYLHKSAAEALLKAYDELQSKNIPLTFIIYDCYRPQSAHKKLWEAFPNPRYVARPERGSRHSRGCAVDLGLARMDGSLLVMPSEFDYFGVEAHMNNEDIADLPKANRELLKNVMTNAGFTYTRTEWWHFDGPGYKNYPLMDIAVK
ncbi:D-alanyl-D-alanine dipeptidase [Parelusimicrobium proximum]|uniref:M15 family metallopeptidase n=1 Tax=Parelusimicrobium proximum TaxID=3228953 RepID=UPI003D16A6F0